MTQQAPYGVGKLKTNGNLCKAQEAHLKFGHVKYDSVKYDNDNVKYDNVKYDV